MEKITTRGLGYAGSVPAFRNEREPVRAAYLDVAGAIDCYEYYAARSPTGDPAGCSAQQYIHAGVDHDLHCLGLGLAIGPLSMAMIVDDLAGSLADAVERMERDWWRSNASDLRAFRDAMAVAGLGPWYARIRARKGPREAGRQLARATRRLHLPVRGTMLQRVRALLGRVPAEVKEGVLHAHDPRPRDTSVDRLAMPLAERLVHRQQVIREQKSAARLRVAVEYVAEVRRRGGEVEIEGAYRTEQLEMVECRTGHDRLALLRVEGWRQYSRRFGARRARLAYLCGLDDNGAFAVRVPGSCESVDDALAFVEPPEVRRARQSGRTVLRQGDVYAVATHKASDGKGLPALAGTRHAWDAVARVLHHGDPSRPHLDLHVPFPALFVRQRAYVMGRSGARGRAD